MFKTKVDIRQLEKLGAGLRKVQDNIVTLEQARSIRDMIIRQTKDRIDFKKRNPRGHKWKKWTAKYAKTRGPGDSLLYHTGSLRNSIKGRIRLGVVTVYSDTPYAWKHQFGSPNENIPARQFFGISNVDQAEMLDFLLRDIRSRIKI